MFFLYFSFECYVDHRDIHVLSHSFPPRRSSYLFLGFGVRAVEQALAPASQPAPRSGPRSRHGRDKVRSEEHTSELQSLMRNSYAVFCLKKKKERITLD